jgi:hypothetical protein
MTCRYMKPQFSCADTDVEPATANRAAADIAIVDCFSDIEGFLVRLLDEIHRAYLSVWLRLFVIIYILARCRVRILRTIARGGSTMARHVCADTSFPALGDVGKLRSTDAHLSPCSPTYSQAVFSMKLSSTKPSSSSRVAPISYA